MMFAADIPVAGNSLDLDSLVVSSSSSIRLTELWKTLKHQTSAWHQQSNITKI